MMNAGPETMSMIQFNDKLNLIQTVKATKNVKEWTCEEVAEILKNFDLKQHKENFLKNQINGRALLLLKESDFHEVGIKSFNDKILLRELIKKIKKIKHL